MSPNRPWKDKTTGQKIASVFRTLLSIIIVVLLGILVALVWDQRGTIRHQDATITDLSTVLERRSPTLDHISCYEGRLSASLAATQALSNKVLDVLQQVVTGHDAKPEDLNEIARLRKLRDEASDALTNATNPDSDQACPALPIPKKGAR